MKKELFFDFSNYPDYKSLDEFEKIEDFEVIFQEAKLTENEKVVYKMRVCNDFSFNRIANVMNISQYEAYTYYKRAENKIKKWVKLAKFVDKFTLGWDE